MTTDTSLDPTQQRPKRRWPAFALIGLLALGTAGVGYGRVLIADTAAALPKTPDVATMPVSTEVVDRNG